MLEVICKFRISAAGRQELTALADAIGVSAADVVRLGIRRVAAEQRRARARAASYAGGRAATTAETRDETEARMTDNSPRARLNQLLEQLVPSAAKRDQWMEIFRLAKVADLSASWRPPVPLPVREVINSPAKLATARRKLTDLEYEERRLARIPDFKRRAVDDDRLRAVRHEITTLGTEVRLAAHMQGAAA